MKNIKSKLDKWRGDSNKNIVVVGDSLFIIGQDWAKSLHRKTPYVGDLSPFDSGISYAQMNKFLNKFLEKDNSQIVNIKEPQKWKEKGKECTGSGDKEVCTPKFVKDNDKKPSLDEGDIIKSQHRLYCSRMWYYADEIHKYVPGSINIKQGKSDCYSDGDITFKLRAYKVGGSDGNGHKKNGNDKNGNFMWGHNLTRVGNWEVEYAFKNASVFWTGACFGKNTILKLSNNKEKHIWKIKPGDILENNNKVTGIMKCKVGSNEIFKLNNILVTGTHRVLYNGEFIETCEHPDAVKDENYNEEFVYCLNTESKTIKIADNIFTDWDELNQQDIINLTARFSNEIERECEENKTIGKIIHKYIDSGFHPDTYINMQNGNLKQFKYIKCGDTLEGGNKVTTIIKISAKDIDIYKHNINGSTIIGTQNLVYIEDDKIKTTYYNEKDWEIYNNNSSQVKYLYHIITDNNKLSINEVQFAGYNKNLEIFL